MKKILVLAIAAAMLLSFTACGKDDGEAVSSADSSSNASSSVEVENDVSSDADASSEDELEDEVGNTPEYEDIYDSEKVEIIGNDVVKTSIAGEITQIMRFTFNNEKTAVTRVRLEFYTTTEVNFDEEVELYKELGYTIIEADKTHLIMDANDESIEAWSSQATTMEELAELLKA